MFDIRITLLVLGLPIGFLAFAYLVVPRQTKNFFMRLLPAWKKRYVVCHLTYQAGLTDVFLVVPNKLGLTTVGKFDYLLNDLYVALTYEKRHHYVLDENNVIPKRFVEHTKEEVVFQTSEIKNALENNVMEYLFSKKKEMLIIGLFIVAIIATLAIAYNIMNVNELKSLIQNPPVEAVQYVTTSTAGK